MEAEIKKIIEENLPAQVGDVLKKRLEQADRDVDTIKTLETNLKKRTGELKEANKEIETLRERWLRDDELKQRDETLTKRENKINVFQAELRAQEAQNRADEIFSLVDSVFKNPRIRKSIFNQHEYHNEKGGNVLFPTQEEITEE